MCAICKLLSILGWTTECVVCAWEFYLLVITMVVCDSLLYFYAIMKVALADLVDHHTDILCPLRRFFNLILDTDKCTVSSICPFL